MGPCAPASQHALRGDAAKDQGPALAGDAKRAFRARRQHFGPSFEMTSMPFFCVIFSFATLLIQPWLVRNWVWGTKFEKLSKKSDFFFPLLPNPWTVPNPCPKATADRRSPRADLLAGVGSRSRHVSQGHRMSNGRHVKALLTWQHRASGFWPSLTSN